MGLILGMDAGVFAAWVLTILAAILCVLYGVYHEFIKKTNRKKSSKKDETEKSKTKGDM